MIRSVSLTDGWTITPAGQRIPDLVRAAGAIPATVPGTVTTDLLEAGLIDDPFLDDNERAHAWIGHTDWIYRLEFPWEPDGHVVHELVFDGIDTVAIVALNGEELGTARNMHRAHRFEVTSRLRPGANLLEVRIESPIAAANAASTALGYRPHVNHHPYNAIRKAAYSYGWDWGIDTSTSGLWREVRIESWSTARAAELTVAGHALDGVAHLTASVQVTDTGPDRGGLELRIALGEQEWIVPIIEGHARLDVAVTAELWWPRGHGHPRLYEVNVDLVADGEVVDSRVRRIGFRSVEFIAESAADGGTTQLRVNDRPIEVRGANWIPEDAFLPRMTCERYRARIADAEFAELNLLRVWGGGIYESDLFFDACDEAGILTWQDFLFACASYSEDEPLAVEVELEGREAVARLASHPSLVVLNGNNENLWGRQEWGWDVLLDGKSWGEDYYYRMLPGLVAELAPHVAYTPGSPFSSSPTAVQNAEDEGTMHIWDMWNTRDYLHYRDYKPRFVSEFGWQGPPTWATLTGAISDRPLTPESPGMQVHQKAAAGNVKLTRGLIPHIALPDSMDDWHWAMSLNQANAVRTAIEWYRSLTPDCTGAIVWQLNDCWPVVSWSAVDSWGRAKPLLYALRQANAPRLLTIQPGSQGLILRALNDTSEPWNGDATVVRQSFAGETLAAVRVRLDIDARGHATMEIPEALERPEDSGAELLVATMGAERALWFFAEYRDSALDDPGLAVQAERAEGGWRLIVSTVRLARDVSLAVDRLDPDAHASTALVTLLPGERVEVTVRGAEQADPSDFEQPRILRSANQLVR